MATADTLVREADSPAAQLGSTRARANESLGVRAIATVLGAYAASRLLLVVAAFVQASRHDMSVITVLSQWDGGDYIAIAVSGYPSHVVITPYMNSVVAFFPLFPLLGKGLALITGLPVAWALVLVTWLAGVASSVLAAVLVRDRYGARAGLQAGVLLAVFPGSVVDGVVYADGVAVAFALAALLAADRRRFVLAGLLGAGATSSLSLMVLPVAAALAAAALVARSWRGLIAPVLASCGGGAYLVYLWAHTGSLFTWSRVERAGWLVHPSLPWSGVTAFDTYAFSRYGVATLTVASIVVAVFGFSALYLVRAPLPWVVLAVAVVAVVTFDGGAWLAPRFLFDAFPLVLASAIALSRRLLWPVAVLSTLMLGALLAAYAPWNRVFLNF